MVNMEIECKVTGSGLQALKINKIFVFMVRLAMKKVAILQSNYIPWKGYFDIIASVDEFIIYDEVQYTKNDWRNRNRIKTPNGVQWITIPVRQNKLSQKISETEVFDLKWRNKNWNTIITNYAKAPCFKTYAPQFEKFYRTFNATFLSEINVTLLKLICDMLNIKTTILNSADYELKGNPTEKLINLCKQLKAQVYLSGPSAKNYLDESLFSESGIAVEWMDYTMYPEYYQLNPPFEHGVSIIDLLFNEGEDSVKYMKNCK
jgi:hypothetical protein